MSRRARAATAAAAHVQRVRRLAQFPYFFLWPLFSEAANLAAVQALYTAIANGPSFEPFERLCDPSVCAGRVSDRLLPIRRPPRPPRAAGSHGQGSGLDGDSDLELASVAAMADRVLVEGRSSGTVGATLVPLQRHGHPDSLCAGLRFRQGKIVAISHTTDCFDPW